MVVVDASVLVAAVADSGSDGQWAERVLMSGALVAPHLVLAEVAGAQASLHLVLNWIEEVGARVPSGR